MLETIQGDYGSRYHMNASEELREISNRCAQLFPDELGQIEDHTFFAAFGNELAKMEHFFPEPKFNGLVDGTPSFDPFSYQRCFNIEGLSAVEYSYITPNCDMLTSSVTHGEQSENELFKRKLEGSFDGTETPPDICEEYLLDADYIPSKESFVDNVDPNHHSIESSGPIGSNVKVELSTANIPMLEEAMAVQDSSFLDKMTTKELHNTFSNVFGRETDVKDQQWLKQRILFGLKNLDVFDNVFKFTENSATFKSNDVEEALVLSTSNECTQREVNPLNDVFNFKTKTRVRNVKRGKHVNYDYLKSFSSEVSKVSDFTELRKERVLVKEKRQCRPTQRYIEGKLEHNSKHRRQRYRSYETVSESKVFCEGRNTAQNFRKKPGSTAFILAKETFTGGCIQVPFDVSAAQECRMKMSIESEIEDSRLHNEASSDIDPYPSESEDSFSEEDDHNATTKQGKSRRKHHKLWSLPEVLLLVEGVSSYGVGKWTEIKRLLFPSYEHRTSVDLKDKWRNLLRASSQGLHAKQRGDPIRKNASNAIPQDILRRVRELALMYPYPRPRARRG